MIKHVKSCLTAAVSALLLIGLDQWTKFLAVANLKNQKPVELIPGALELNYYENHGAAFGLLQNQRVFFIVLTIVLVIILGYLYWKIPQTKRFLPLRIIAVFVMAGAAGNFIDRFMNGYVVDFIYFKLINFPIFNVADCYITVSAAALLILAFFFYKEDEDWAWMRFSRKKHHHNGEES